MKPQCETAAQCLRELARVMEQFGIRGIKQAVYSQYVKFYGGNYRINSLPFFDSPEDWQFAIAEVEGKPVFIGDELWDMNRNPCKALAASNNSRVLVEYNDDSTYWFAQTELSWNPPKPKTVMVELPIETIEQYSNLLKVDLPKHERIIGEACKKALEDLK